MYSNPKQHNASLTDIIRIVNKILDMQSHINNGDIKIADQHEAYKRSVAEYKRLKKQDEIMW